MKNVHILITLLGCFASVAFADIELPRRWEYSAPLISPEKRDADPSHAQKDPTVVHHDGRWHVFMTVKLPGRSVIEYCSFEKWETANASKRTLLTVSDSDYFCAPQVFYFEPHKKWYLVYQVGMPGSKKMWVAYSTTSDISNPASWTKAQPMPGLDGGPDDPREVGGLDYWIICDDARAYLFFTSLNGKLWRLSTGIEQFPAGFGDCTVTLEAEIFEASHTYKLKGQDKYLTLIEQDGRRYFKAYIADRLDGEWTAIADTEAHPFAGATNIRPRKGVEAWTDNISHGELIRDSNDQRFVIDPDHLQLLFQGMLEKQKSGKGYGQFDWRLGLLTPDSTVQITLVGDSTVATANGWGDGFEELLKDSAKVHNAAKNGRSSKSFRSEGLWKPVIENPGDYLLIQFGHNDQPGKGPERESAAATDFRDHLRQYVKEAQSVGMKPVLVTSLTRRHWGKDGKIVPSLAEYAEATKAVATELGLPLIDLHALSITHANAIGAEAYEQFEPKTEKGIDHTHLNSLGSREVAKLVAEELVRVVPELADHFNF
ncbi:MAG: hypothetical protein KDN22_02285 [Verrucomicrobiae bacterium]|nr:hypothetical protein [Verrucomicrobiae bacterium]